MHRTAEEAREPAGAELDPDGPAGAGEHPHVAAAVDTVDGGAVRLEDEVHARVRDDLLAVGRACALSFTFRKCSCRSRRARLAENSRK